MTLSEIESYSKDILRPDDIAECICTRPQIIRETARENPLSLGFPVIVTKRNVKIPKQAFINYMKGVKINIEK